MDMHLNELQRAAYDLAITGHNVLITGQCVPTKVTCYGKIMGYTDCPLWSRVVSAQSRFDPELT